VDIRVSVIPMLHGEAVVMRLLRQSGTLRGMDVLGLDPRELKSFRRVLGLPHGIILVTGPTGSGKTSTLYTALNEINDAVRKIITIEDPIEYQLKGINQIQVSEKAGLTFARGLRSILRHDPDVILVGEIRDQETGADRGAGFAHWPFGFLDAPHQRRARSSYPSRGYGRRALSRRVIARSSARATSGACAVPALQTEDVSPAAQTLKIRLEMPPNVHIYRAVGCRECRNTGYHGRRAIFEWMDSNNELRQMILKNCSSDQLA
jgi:type II secretory ATPase GspE/PulE/Tfp pilus assembly ATPase PilB-like protein